MKGTIVVQSNPLVEAEIELRQKEKGLELSICGVVYRGSVKRDCYEVAGGQVRFSEHVDSPLAARLDELNKLWHLNGLRPGCEHQRAAGWDRIPIDPSKPLDTYGSHFEGLSASWNMLTWVTRADYPGGLLSQACPTCGYKFGSAWLHEELPAEVVAEVTELCR